jgi:IS30 family transposase
LRDKGMTLPEIAQALSVDKRTVSRYLKRGSA